MPHSEQDTLLLDFHFGLELSCVAFLLIHLTKLCRYKNICSIREQRAESRHCLPQFQFLENVFLCLHILIFFA